MKKTLIIGKNSFLASKFRLLKNSKIISHKSLNKVSFENFDNIILLSMPNSYKKKISNLKFEKKIIKRSKNKRFIYFSTSRVYPNILNNKESFVKPQNIYARNKIKIEKEIKKNLDDYLIIRPPIIFNKKKYSKGNFFDILNKNFKKNKIKFNMNENSVRDLITLNDLYFYYKKMEKIKLKGCYNIGSKKGLSIKQILKYYYGDKLNRNKIKLSFKKNITNLTLTVNKLERQIGIFHKKVHKNIIRELQK